MFRIALIGAGDHSRRAHATPLARFAQKHPGVIELSAVCDLAIERAADFQQTFGFKTTYASIEQMLSIERLDACVCIVPVNQVVPVSSYVLTRGVPCLIEKPLGNTLDEGRRLVDVAASTKTAHMVSMNRRFMPHLNEAIALARAAGPMRFARAAMLRHNRREPEFVEGTGIHAVDALRHIAGEVAEIQGKRIGAPELSEIWGTATLRFESGCTGELTLLPTSGVEEESYEFCGEGYRAHIAWQKMQDLRVRFWREGRLILDRSASPLDTDDELRGDYAETESLISALRGETPWQPSVFDVLNSMRLCATLAEQFRI